MFDKTTDQFLGFANRPNDLAPAESYVQTADFTIPNGLAGLFYVFVAADSGNSVFERGIREQ